MSKLVAYSREPLCALGSGWKLLGASDTRLEQQAPKRSLTFLRHKNEHMTERYRRRRASLPVPLAGTSRLCSFYRFGLRTIADGLRFGPRTIPEGLGLGPRTIREGPGFGPRTILEGFGFGPPTTFDGFRFGPPTIRE
jgi:hypothetical protein